MTEEESSEYFKNDIVVMKEMNCDISEYLEKEKEYEKLFSCLFKLNKGYSQVKLKKFSFYNIDYLFDDEKPMFIEFFRKL